MQIKFLTIYHEFDNVEYSKQQAQDSLLFMWMRSLQLQQVKFISTAKVEFKDYALLNYPDQEKAKKEIYQAYSHRNKKTKHVEYWWCGKQYSDFDTLYNALAEQKHLMELIITVEDYD